MGDDVQLAEIKPLGRLVVLTDDDTADRGVILSRVDESKYPQSYEDDRHPPDG